MQIDNGDGALTGRQCWCQWPQGVWQRVSDARAKKLQTLAGRRPAWLDAGGKRLDNVSSFLLGADPWVTARVCPEPFNESSSSSQNRRAVAFATALLRWAASLRAAINALGYGQRQEGEPPRSVCRRGGHAHHALPRARGPQRAGTWPLPPLQLGHSGRSRDGRGGCDMNSQRR